MQFESYRPRNRQGVGQIQQEGKMFQSDCQSRLRSPPCVGPLWLGCKTLLPFRDLSAPFSHFILLNSNENVFISKHGTDSSACE